MQVARYALLFVLPLLAIADVVPEKDSLTVVVTRTVEVGAGEAVLSLSLSLASTTPGPGQMVGVGLAPVMEALKPFGILERHMVGSSDDRSFQFRVLVPFGVHQLPELIAGVNKAIRSFNVGMNIAASGSVSVVSVVPSRTMMEEVRQQLLPELLVEARRKAETLSQAAQLTLGRVSGISEAVNVLDDHRVAFQIIVRFDVLPQP